MVKLKGVGAVSQDAENVCGESEVAVTGCCCEDVEANT